MLGPAKVKKEAPSKTKVKKIEILNVKVCFSGKLLLLCGKFIFPQRVVPGMLLLGAVLEVQEYVVVFSLPFNMRGTITINDVSGHMTELVESEVLHMNSSQDDGEVGVAMSTNKPPPPDPFLLFFLPLFLPPNPFPPPPPLSPLSHLVFPSLTLSHPSFPPPPSLLSSPPPPHPSLLPPSFPLVLPSLPPPKVTGSSEVPLMERLFSVGQLMPCYVQAVEKGRVSLSVNPELINSHLSAKDLKPKLVQRQSVVNSSAIMRFFSESETAAASTSQLLHTV